MFTLESRFFFGFAALAVIAGALYLAISGDEVGSGLLLFVGAGATAGALAFVDAGQVRAPALDGAAVDDGVGGRGDDDGPPPPSAWPLAAALAATLFVLGLAIDLPLVVLGLLSLAVAAGGWFNQSWMEHRSHANATALDAHERILWPAGLPLLVLIGIAVAVVSFSRVLLAVDKDVAWPIAFVVAAGILAGCALFANRTVSGGVLASVGAVAGLVVVVAGVVAAASGEREFHYQGPAKVTLVAEGTVFDQEEISAPAHNLLLLDFDNRDQAIQHNVAVYQDEEAAEVIYQGEIIEGVDSIEYRIRVPEAGEYFYRCDVHPVDMTGTLVAEAPEEGEAHEG